MSLTELDFETAELIQPNGHAMPEGLEGLTAIYFLDRPVSGTPQSMSFLSRKSPEGGSLGLPKKQRLRVFVALPNDRPDPRGTLFLCPGRTEFIEKYLESVADLTARGFCVVVIDPRGQGLSSRLLPDRLKSYVGTFQDYADDFGWVIDQLSPHCPKPYITIGHSMGGTIVLQSVLSGTTNPSAVICLAPMLGLMDLDTSLMQLSIKSLSAMGLSTKNLPMQRQRSGLPVAFADNKLTSDRTRYQRWAAFFQDTPRLRVGEPTFGWIAAALSGMNFVNRNAADLNVPALMVAAGGDQIVDPASVEAFASRSQSSFHVVPGAKHELFLERDNLRDDFFGVFDQFLEAQAL